VQNKNRCISLTCRRCAGSITLQEPGRGKSYHGAFLCSVHAGYITGQNLTIDGGLVRSML
jgi:3-oxoacyl-[acyl-carrier protein] reductase